MGISWPCIFARVCSDMLKIIGFGDLVRLFSSSGPPCACLTIGYYEETKLSTQEITKYFNQDQCKFTAELLKRQMDAFFCFFLTNGITFENLF